MTEVYAATAPAWLEAVRTMAPSITAAFWQPTAARPRKIKQGERWYFKELGRPVIRGFGIYQDWESLSLAQLFSRYGHASGYASADELLAGMREFRETATLQTEVGNVLLNGIQIFPKPLPLTEFGLSDLSVRFVYMKQPDPLAHVGSPAQVLSPGPISPDQPAAGFARAQGPTVGITPSDWSRTVSHQADGPAQVYALRFGAHNIWKIGWCADIGKRLKSINDHIPEEVIPHKWKCIYTEPAPTQRDAFQMEQFVLQLLVQFRTMGERVRCSESEVSAAWTQMVMRLRSKVP